MFIKKQIKILEEHFLRLNKDEACTKHYLIRTGRLHPIITIGKSRTFIKGCRISSHKVIQNIFEKCHSMNVMIYAILSFYFDTFSGTTLADSGYINWGYGQPDGAARGVDERCGSMFYNGHLNDIRCDRKCFFICEHEVDTLATKFDNRFD